MTELKTQCEMLLERHELDIEEWYFRRQEEAPLIDFLCRDRVLHKKDSECLYEVVKPKGEKGDDDEKPKKKSSKKKKEAAEETPNEEL